MSHRSRASRVKQHVHCDSCYSRRCRARVEVSVCCAVAPCRLLCGAVYHLCKEEDHLLLCPNVRVPCLNVGYGCPVHLPRSSQAAHLQVCPASVVSCSMEWIRWPTDDTSPHCSMALQENLMQENEGRAEDLDLAMALVDQSDLYSRLKMKPLYPELMEEEEEEVNDERNEETAAGGVVNGVVDLNTNHEENGECERNPTEETAQINVNANMKVDLSLLKEKYNMTEMMFGMERGGCAAAQADQDNPKAKRQDSKGKKASEDQKESEKGSVDEASKCPPPDTSKTGLAPWDEGVIERLGRELTPQEFNMYVVHHGRMLMTFGHIHACTPREKDFVYGSLEPIPVQTLRSFKVPDSYHYRRRVHLYDTAARVQSETRSVDTSDLGATEEDWLCDEAAATLLGYAEQVVMGHKISELKAADGLFVDEGTQTHSFRSSPFKGKTTLAEVMVDRPLKLRLELQAERVNSRHNKACCAFTFLCGHTFHRREFATHFRNVHSDIQTSLSGWFEQRCPLAYLGCTYSQRRFQPSTHKATVSYNQQLRSFNLRPTPDHLPCDDSQSITSPADSSSSSAQRRRRGGAGGSEDSLSSLPYEVLCHMASFLDSMSLSQLALVSRLMRQVCSALLQDRGMVTLRWERKTYSHGGAKWKAKPVWQFSYLFSKVDSWHMTDNISPISAHLKVCPYYKTSVPSEPVPLPSMSEKKKGQSEERLTLIKQFTGNRWKQ